VATKAEAISNAEPVASAARPDAPGWLHQLLRGLERLPGPPWVWYAVIGLVSSLIYHLEFWASGRTAFGAVDAENTYWGVVLFAGLCIVAYLEGVASDAVDTARPALRLSVAEIERLRYNLVVAPALPAAAALGVAVALAVVGTILDPVGSYIVGVPGPIVIVAVLVGVLTNGMLYTVLAQLIRQVRLIRATLDRSAIIDPFLPGPLSGFSRLTSRVGIAVIVVVTSGLLFTVVPTDPVAFLFRSLPFLVVAPAIALAAFVVPVYGVHTRLKAEKERLQDGAEHRVKALLAALNEDVDRLDMARADGLNKQLSSMLQQRDVLAKLPTWPWSTGTFRAVITAIFLPIVLFMVQSVLSRILFS
jgi:hypothetical protein